MSKLKILFVVLLLFGGFHSAKASTFSQLQYDVTEPTSCYWYGNTYGYCTATTAVMNTTATTTVKDFSFLAKDYSSGANGSYLSVSTTYGGVKNLYDQPCTFNFLRPWGPVTDTNCGFTLTTSSVGGGTLLHYTTTGTGFLLPPQATLSYSVSFSSYGTNYGSASMAFMGTGSSPFLPYYSITTGLASDGIIATTQPYPQTYFNNPITFAGTYANSGWYNKLQIDLVDITAGNIPVDLVLQDLPPLSTENYPYSYTIAVPYPHSYKWRVRLYGESAWTGQGVLTTAWTTYKYFDLGSTSYAPLPAGGYTFATSSWEGVNTFCNPIMATSSAFFGVTYNTSLSPKGCMEALFVPDSTQLTSAANSFKEKIATHFPLGYVTDFLSIMATTTESTLTVLDATLPSALGLGSSKHISFDLNHSLDWVLNATSTVFNNASASSTQTLFQITNEYWKKILYIMLAFYLFSRLFGERWAFGWNSASSQGALGDTSSKDDSYALKEALYKQSYRGRGGLGPFKEDKNRRF
jgi:hypothetical protein